jgi:hypothetical protein
MPAEVPDGDSRRWMNGAGKTLGISDQDLMMTPTLDVTDDGWTSE